MQTVPTAAAAGFITLRKWDSVEVSALFFAAPEYEGSVAQWLNVPGSI